MASQPTTGAAERDSHSWQAWPGVALAIRFLAFVLPLASAAFVVRIVSNSLYRGEGAIGLLAWILQAAVIGIAVSLLVDRATRRLLPLAALFSMSLVFPDEAPSRFSVALRTGSTGRLRSSAGRVQPIEPGTDPNQAAAIALGLIADLARHDRLTRGHTERVRAYSDMIGEEMELDDDARIRLSWAGLLHDIGKLTVPEPILNKPGRPNAEEWEVLSSHPAAALGLLGPLADWLGDWVLAATQHHERWDGDGYPAGLAGTDISLAGRIVAVADTYDVITSKRSYKESMSPEAARRELVACSGSQFDPEVVRAFLNVSLGRRWLAGPFASLMNLPFGSVGGVVSPLPAAIAAAAIAVGVGSMPAAPVSDDVLAFASDTTVEVAMPEAEAARAERQVTVAPPSTATSTPLSSAPRATTTTISEPDPSTTTLLDPLATTAPPSTSTSSTTSPTTAPTTAPSTTQNPPTTPAAPSTTTTTTTSTTTAAASRAPAAEPPSSPARMPAPSSSASTPSPPPTTPTT
ncbi:MAG: HD-GYP domain-containing protein, partial [Acidimicrobiales bacterium]